MLRPSPVPFPSSFVVKKGSKTRPSISEGMPVSVLEALACGVPVFTSNCGGVDEIINQKNGRIFQVKDADALADLLYSFVKGGFEFHAKEISRDIIEKFGEEAFKQKLLNIYSRVI